MSYCNRFGAIHLFRLFVEIILIIFFYTFGWCRLGLVFGYNDKSSMFFFLSIHLMAAIEVYSLIFILYNDKAFEHTCFFHLPFYFLLALLSLICCSLSIIGFVNCLKMKSNELCSNSPCSFYWIGIVPSAFLTILYFFSAQFIWKILIVKSN